MTSSRPTTPHDSPRATPGASSVASSGGCDSRAGDSRADESRTDASRAVQGEPATAYRRRLLGLAAALAFLGGLALAIDLPVARWFKAHRPPSEVMRLLNFSEVFAHGTGVAVILLVAAVLDHSLLPGSLSAPSSLTTAGRRHTFRRLWTAGLGRLIAAAYTGGLLVDVIKALVDRVRPRAADLANAASALATFGEQATAGLVARGFSTNSDFNSFPSGHSATAAGLAAALAWKYPRGRWLFATLAALGVMQRVATLAHYPSDVLLGAALGVAGAALFLGKSATESGPP